MAHFMSKDFAKTVNKALKAKGIEIYGATFLPSADGSGYANGERGYLLNDNGCSRIRTYREVIALAAG